MTTTVSRYAVSAAAVLVAVGVVAAAAVGAPKPAKSEYSGVSIHISHQLDQVKAALSKYESVAQAKADGYVAGSPCESKAPDAETSSDGGGMGIHYINQANMADGKLIGTKPEILVYAPTAGGLQLVAAEYFQPDADQNLATDSDRPSLFGRAFDGPMLGHAPGMPIHYDLHVWLWKHNPSGTFAPWNPAVSCK